MKNFRKFLKENKDRVLRALIICLFSGMFLYALNSYSADEENKIELMLYTDFVKELKKGTIDTIYYNTSDEYMTVTFLNEETKDMTREERDKYTGYTNKDKRKVLYPAYDTFRKDVLEADTNIRLSKGKTILTNILSTLITFAIPIMWILAILHMYKAQLKGIDEKDVVQTSDVRFDDVIGHEEILDDIKFITNLIKNPELGDTVGAKVPKGLLLTGEPGTGKTLIAKAIAGEAGVPFLYQNASGFIEMYVGLGAKRVRELFQIAKKNAPCIIFIDEIDAVGTHRDSVKNSSENEQTINALLQEMDGFSSREGVFVIAATNRANKLDKALTRAGRFDRQIVVNPPRDWKVRRDLFEHYLKNFSVGDDVDLDTLSRQVSGFTGADISTICNEASIIAVMQNKEFIDMACIEEAIDKKVFKGNRSKRESHKKDKEIVAYHESGHAVASWLLGEPIARASILSTVSGVGGAVFNEDKETLFTTKKDFENSVVVLYAGRASEEIRYGGDNVTTGASNDITVATQKLISYIEKFGFKNDFGLLDIEVLNQTHYIDSKHITKILSAMSAELYSRSMKLLQDNYSLVEILAQKLLEVETLSGNEIEELFKGQIKN